MCSMYNIVMFPVLYNRQVVISFLKFSMKHVKVSNGPSTGGAGSTTAGTKAAEKTEENIPDKKPESESEEEDDFGFDLFG